MNCIIRLVLTISLSINLFSCAKHSGASGNPSSLTVFNGLATSTGIITDLSGSPVIYYSNVNPVPYGGYQEYGVQLGESPISVVQISDTLDNLFSGSLNLSSGGIYSLYLIGDTSRPDTLFTKETISAYPLNDSVAGVRFINLSQGSLPMTVNLQGADPGQSDFTNLVYKQVPSFRQYPANSNAPGSYTFEVHDKSSGNLLCTFIWQYTIFDNNTLVITGSEDPTSQTPLQVSPINNY